MGVWYFMWFKGLNVRDAVGMACQSRTGHYAHRFVEYCSSRSRLFQPHHAIVVLGWAFADSMTRHSIPFPRMILQVFQIINSLSAVAYGNFDPTTPVERFLTVVFLFVGLGFMGTFVGMIASR
jgi:hypothetical protein